MPVQSRYSRDYFCEGVPVGDGALMLTEREPFGFVLRDDTTQHVASEGDTWHTLAARYYAPMSDASHLWWVIADFQPEPVHDPTIVLVPGAVVYVPSLRTLEEEVFSEVRRAVTAA